MRRLILVLSLFLLLSVPLIWVQAQENIPRNLNRNVQPAPAAILPNLPLIHGGAMPENPSYNGPWQYLRNGRFDLEAGTVTLPLYRGQMESGEAVWFILTDTNDAAAAEAMGINFTEKFSYADVEVAVRPARVEFDGSITFERGTVDFAPERAVTPGENIFPPSEFQPGGVGDVFYSPLARFGDYIYNAPMMAFNVEAEDIDFCEGNPDKSLVHDKVIAICPSEGTVTLRLGLAFSAGRPILYLNLDAGDAMVAAIDSTTYAPALAGIVLGREDSVFKPVEPLIQVINGPMGADNPFRQGVQSTLSGEGVPIAVFGDVPHQGTGYSPLWGMALVEWTPEAIEAGYRTRLMDMFTVFGLVEQGWLVAPGGQPFGYTGIIVNCPVAYRLW